MLTLIGYAVLIAIAINAPRRLIARQEFHIEGPFGWNSLTFTKRYFTNHLYSKIFRLIVGKDKWATGYHFNANGVWTMIFFTMFCFLPFYSYLTGAFDWKAVFAMFDLALCSFITFTMVEDATWFWIHPYYGPDRHNIKYVPWFQYFAAGIPVQYIAVMVGTLILSGATSLIIRDWRIAFVWSIALAIISVYVLVIERLRAKKLPRKPLKPYWWKSVTHVIMERCPYPSEGVAEPNPGPVAWSIPNSVVQELIAQRKVFPLDQALAE